MNKEDLINAVAKSTCTKAEAAKALDAILGAIKKSLKKGETVTLVGFGTFKVAKRSARREEIPRPVNRSRLRPRRSLNLQLARH